MSRYENIVSMWHSFNITATSDIDKYLDSFRILFTYNSCKIENSETSYHNTRDIFENNNVCGYTGNVRTLLEIYNHKLCYEALKCRIAEKQPVSIDLIKEIHLILTSGTYDEVRFIVNGERSGEFKKHNTVVGTNIGVAPEKVENELHTLFNELDKYSPSALVRAAYLHANFEHIHPFTDGNGRVGRLLMNYYLMINDHPPLIVYDEDKNEYYNVLEEYDKSKDIAPLYEFMKFEIDKTRAKTLERNML